MSFFAAPCCGLVCMLYNPEVDRSPSPGEEGTPVFPRLSSGWLRRVVIFNSLRSGRVLSALKRSGTHTRARTASPLRGRCIPLVEILDLVCVRLQERELVLRTQACVYHLAAQDWPLWASPPNPALSLWEVVCVCTLHVCTRGTVRVHMCTHVCACEERCIGTDRQMWTEVNGVRCHRWAWPCGVQVVTGRHLDGRPRGHSPLSEVVYGPRPCGCNPAPQETLLSSGYGCRRGGMEVSSRNAVAWSRCFSVGEKK